MVPLDPRRLPREDLLPIVEDGATKADLCRITGLSKEGLASHLRRLRLVQKMNTCAVCGEPASGAGRRVRVCSARCERALATRRRRQDPLDHPF